MNEQISSLLRRKEVIPASVGLAAFIGGGALGYILGKRNGHFEGRVLEIVALVDEEELEHHLYGSQEGGEVLIVKEDEGKWVSMVSTPAKTVTLHDVELRSVSLSTDSDPPGYIVGVTPIPELEDESEINVYEEPDEEGWDWEAEKSTRSKTEPYVLHKDEFFADDFGYTQTQLTYYEGDDIMADESQRNKPLYGHTAMLGELKFGHGSGDEDLVYIRNELLEHEFEVARHHGRFEVEVLGLELDEEYAERDLKHSNVPRFRMD